MAAPAESPEQAFRLRRFSGVNTLTDPVFLGPQFLAHSQNWIPNQTFRLSKKPGSRLYATTGNNVTNITAVGRYYVGGLRYLYWYGQRTASHGRDILCRSIEDAAVEVVTPAFTEDVQLGRMIRYGDYLYVGNGVEDIRQVKISGVVGDPGTVVPLTIVALLADIGSVTATPITGSTVAMDTGSYEYAWAVYNTETKLYISRTDPQSLDVPVDTYVTAVAPATALLTNQVYRFFVSPQGWPIEYATAQGKDFTAFTTTTTDNTKTFSTFDVTNDRVPVTNNVRRTGNKFTVYRGRVVFAGNETDPNALYATGVILPGLEQDVFNQGAFFPAAARVVLPDRVTAIGVSGSTGPQDPRSPLVACTTTKTFLFMGDPFDPEADFAQIQLSDQIGCPAHDTMVPTSEGLIFMGMDSVYLLPADGSPPKDVGWPIADQIRGIQGNREHAVAIHHKHFYKLAISGFGGGPNVVQWWLDLRQGIGDTPSWWGPHYGPPISAFATALQDPDEQDKGFAAWGDTDTLFLHHQMNLYFDVDHFEDGVLKSVPIHSVLRTGVFDAEQPFLPKVFTRLRAIARAASATSVHVELVTDGGATWDVDAMIMEGPEGAKWYGTLDVDNRARWGTSRWLHLGPLEIQTITPVERPRGLSVEAILSHTDATDLQLRDFEILFIPTGRKVRYLGEKVPK